MAQRVITTLIDDLDGSVIEGKSGRTVSFALEGESYEIDLTEKHVVELEKALAPFLSAARKSSNTGSGRSRPGRPDPAEVRRWARDAGYDVPVRGRLPIKVTEAFEAEARSAS